MKLKNSSTHTKKKEFWKSLSSSKWDSYFWSKIHLGACEKNGGRHESPLIWRIYNIYIQAKAASKYIIKTCLQKRPFCYSACCKNAGLQFCLNKNVWSKNACIKIFCFKNANLIVVLIMINFCHINHNWIFFPLIALIFPFNSIFCVKFLPHFELQIWWKKSKKFQISIEFKSIGYLAISSRNLISILLKFVASKFWSRKYYLKNEWTKIWNWKPSG